MASSSTADGVTSKTERASRGGRKTFSNADLLRLTRAVALAACPTNPMTVSQRAFNTARQAAGHPECPEASYIVKRLDYSWPEFLKLALAEESSSFKTLAQHTREWGQPNIKTCALALRTVAYRLQAKTVRPNEYAQEREEIIRCSRGTNRVQLEEQLPTHGQIEHYGWDTVLQAAGLLTRGISKRIRGIPMTDAIERFLIGQGYLPSFADVSRFANERGFSIVSVKQIGPHIEELRERRTMEGLWTPTRVPKPPSMKPPWQHSKMLSRDAKNPRARRYHWTLERVEQGLRTALAELPPGENLTIQTLLRLSRGSEDIPAPSVVIRVAKQHKTSFSQLRTALR